MKRENYLYIHKVLGQYLNDRAEYPIDYQFGVLGWCENGVEGLNDIMRREPLKSNPELLKVELQSAFNENIDFWWWLNSANDEDIYQQEEPEYGLQVLSMYCWEKSYPEYKGLINFEEYHPEMLKLLCKKYIWDIAFPDEHLSNYRQAKSGMLPTFKL